MLIRGFFVCASGFNPGSIISGFLASDKWIKDFFAFNWISLDRMDMSVCVLISGGNDALITIVGLIKNVKG